MDPITAIGAIAACVQLGSGLLDAIQMIRDLNEVPTQIVNILKEVELGLISIMRIIQPQLPVLRQLSQAQLDRLSPLALEMKSAIEDIDREIRPLGLAAQDGVSKGKRLYRTLWAGLKEKHAKPKLERLQRLTANLLVEMAQLGLETQFQIQCVQSLASSNTSRGFYARKLLTVRVVQKSGVTIGIEPGRRVG